MKKIVLSAVCLVAVAAAGFGGYAYYENQQMDPWLKANLEALSSSEVVTVDCCPHKGGTCLVIGSLGNTIHKGRNQVLCSTLR